MYQRWVGAGLLFMSLLVAGVAAANVKAPYQKQDWAQAEKANGGGLVDAQNQIINVPPWNSTTGWVGFNITLPHANEGKTGYIASGAIEPADGDTNPSLVMAAVNQTGLALLTFDQFSEAAWNASEVYARSSLDSEFTYNIFQFQNLDNSTPYILLFRCLKNGTQDRPILVSVMEKWSELGPLLELAPWSSLTIAAVALAGSGLIIYDLNSQRRKNRLKHIRQIRKDNMKKRA
jgi:hypothetical protein